MFKPRHLIAAAAITASLGGLGMTTANAATATKDKMTATKPMAKAKKAKKAKKAPMAGKPVAAVPTTKAK